MKQNKKHCCSLLSRGKGDAPDRFWATVEPYCTDITEADISLLQEDIKSVRTPSALVMMLV